MRIIAETCCLAFLSGLCNCIMYSFDAGFFFLVPPPSMAALSLFNCNNNCFAQGKKEEVVIYLSV